LRSWSFDHVSCQQREFAPYFEVRGASPFADLSAGFLEYRRAKLTTSATLKQIERKARKLSREVGPLRFELFAEPGRALEYLARWKSEQHRVTGVFDIFRVAWICRVFEEVSRRQTSHFVGMPSLLFAAGQPVAVHLGLANEHVAHVWFPSYDRRFADYSPGMILFLEWFRALADRGVRRVDFGPTTQRYKQHFKTGDLEVGFGKVHSRHLHQWGRTVSVGGKRWLQASRLARPLIQPVRALWRMRRQVPRFAEETLQR
jgi:CelD/BcsL family acetyltransferase involved in cellulose biosynthesis